MDLETSFGSTRRTPNMEEPLLQQHQVEEEKREKELNKEPLFLTSLSSIPFQDGSKAPTSNVFSPKQEQETIPHDTSTPKSSKMAKCSPSETQVKGVLCDSVSGLEGLEVISEDFDGKVDTLGVGVEETCDSKVGFSSKEATLGGQAIEFNGDKKERKKKDGILESKKKKKMLAEVEGVGGVLSNPSGGILEGLKRVDESVRSSLKVEVIDDTALLVRVVSVSKSDYCGVKIGPRDREKNGTGETNGKNEKSAYWRRLEGKKDTRMGEVGKEPKQVNCGGNGGAKNEEGVKIKYSRDEMESMRFVNMVEQRKLWRGIYTGFEGSVSKGYNDLASSKHQRDICCKFNPRPPFGRKGSEVGGVLGEYWLHKPLFGRKGSDAGILGPFVAPRGRRTPVNIPVQ